MIGSLEKYLRVLLAVLALLPGLATMFEVIELPAGDKELLKIAVTSASIVSALIVLTCSQAVRRLSVRAAVLSIGLAFAIGLASLLAWRYYEDRLTVEYTVDGNERSIVLPFSPGPLQRRYEDRGLASALENPNVGFDLAREINDRNGSTPILLMALLVLAQLGLTTSILLGLVRLVDKGPKPDDDA